MTWITTWPNPAPQYAEHATEAEAEKHAAELRAAGNKHATWYEDEETK